MHGAPKQSPIGGLKINFNRRAVIGDRAARTGKVGDGKAFVTAVEQVARSRTGESGESAVSIPDPRGRAGNASGEHWSKMLSIALDLTKARVGIRAISFY